MTRERAGGFYESAVRVQSFVRAYQSRVAYSKLREACISVQSAMRMAIQIRRVRAVRKAVAILETAICTWCSRACCYSL